MQYQDNVFTKIIQKKLSSHIIIENAFAMCFKDINPQASIHYIVIPKRLCRDFSDFQKYASNEEKISLWNTVQQLIEMLDLESYKILTNCGRKAGQEIFHFHVHILSNETEKNLET